MRVELEEKHHKGLFFCDTQVKEDLLTTHRGGVLFPPKHLYYVKNCSLSVFDVWRSLSFQVVGSLGVLHRSVDQGWLIHAREDLCFVRLVPLACDKGTTINKCKGFS